jgi:hypothetical protein
LKARKIDRSLLQGESFELFSAAVRSPATRDPYERKLLGVLKRVNLSPDGLIQFAKENPSAAEKKIRTHRVVILTRLGEALKEEAVRGTEVAEQLLTDSS